MSANFEISYPGPLAELSKKRVISVHSACKIVFDRNQKAQIELESEEETSEFRRYMYGEFNILVLTLGENVTVIPAGAIDQLPFLLDLKYRSVISYFTRT